MGLDIDPSLSWSSHLANLRKNSLKHVAVMACIKEFLPVKYQISLINASIKPILEYFVSIWGSCNARLLDEVFKVKKKCVHIVLVAPFQARTLPLFLALSCYPSIKSVLKQDSFCSKNSEWKCIVLPL